VQHYLWTEWYARERHADRLRESAAARVVVEATRVVEHRRPPRPSPIQVRLERPSDAAALDRLAQLARRSPPRGLVVVAEDGGRVVAAVELDREFELVTRASTDPRSSSWSGCGRSSSPEGELRRRRLTTPD
jgi:hypothetical protein